MLPHTMAARFVECVCSVKARDALLTNFEVLQVVTEVLKKSGKKQILTEQQGSSNVTTIAYEVCGGYL